MSDEGAISQFLLPNTTQIPDLILDRWMARLTGSQFKIVMYVARRTYGFKKGSDEVSIQQMVKGIKRKDGTVLDEGTGLGLTTVLTECPKLEAMEVLKKGTNHSDKGGHEANTWELNLAERPPKKDRGKSRGRHVEGGTSKFEVGSEGTSKTDVGVHQNLMTQYPVGNTQSSATTTDAREESEEPGANVTALGDTASKCLLILSRVKGFPREQADNAVYLEELRQESPDVDAVEVCRQYEVWHRDNPGKTKNYRGRLRNFFRKAQRDGKVSASSPSSGSPAGPQASETAATHPAGVLALETYDNDGRTDLRRFAALSKEWDFALEERPPWKVYARLGQSDPERDGYLNRIRSVVRRAIREEAS